VLDECGLNLSDAIRLFLRQIVVTGGLPFEVKVPTATAQATILEARQTRAQYSSDRGLPDSSQPKRSKKKLADNVSGQALRTHKK